MSNLSEFEPLLVDKEDITEMSNKPSTWVVSRLRIADQEYLTSYHLTMTDHGTDSKWSNDEKCAIQFNSKEEADRVSDRFPGTFVQKFMEYEDDDEEI